MDNYQWIAFFLAVLLNAIVDATINRRENLQGKGIGAVGYLARITLRGILFAGLASWAIAPYWHRSPEIIPLILIQTAVWWIAFDFTYNLIRWRWDPRKMLFYVGTTAPTDRPFREISRVILNTKFNTSGPGPWILQMTAKALYLLFTLKIYSQWDQITNFF